MACEDPGSISGPTDLVLLQSDRRSWRDLLLGPPSAYRGKLLSELIVLADDGPFSHVVLHRGDCVVDARRPTASSPAVGSWPFCVVEGLDRDRTRCLPVDGDLSPAWDRIVEQHWFRHPEAAEVPPGLREEENQFSYGALLLVALNLVTTEWRALRPLGRWLVRRNRDLAGMFCSELIAKAMIDAGMEVLVTVRAGRIPPAGSRGERALIDALVERRDRNLPPASTLTDDDARELFAEQLERIRAASGIADDETVPIGYPGDARALPPSLVTPNDLYRSPSFAFVGNDGTNGDDPPELTPAERSARFRRYLLALLLTPVNAALGGRFRGADPPGPVDETEAD